jgi:allophanate hydrolase subunit 2
LGPTITDGSVVPIGPDPGGPVLVDVAPQRDRLAIVRVLPGPRRDWFTDDAWAQISGGVYTVDQSTSRVGARLHGAALDRVHSGELPSEGLVLGAIQVPHNLQPIVMLADHPVTGGYPVIAVVHPDDLSLVAQAPPGTPLRFAPAR